MSKSAPAVADSVTESLLDIVPRLNRWAESSVAHAAGENRLSLRQLSALTMIESEKTTLGDVARKLMVTPAVVTGLIDRLERRGYVRRINSTDDRRRVLLALTDDGRAAAESVSGALHREMAAALSEFSFADLEKLDACLTKLRPVASELERTTPLDARNA
ncbi:MAG: MarR family transcriptional regulator [Thermomicrobiales bacterium]|nr:MarR family transcriptional regulator [Thermomicrobiales bacterium]MCO5221078.1 MarR family transcriptional regulator [Thermomicrobiales bacterium]